MNLILVISSYSSIKNIIQEPPEFQAFKIKICILVKQASIFRIPSIKNKLYLYH